jgi:non-ribosomal peptide synthase protein (TIGR01720 family)
VEVDQIPLTKTGAIDYEQLIAIGRDAHRMHMERVQPRTEIEHQIATIWKEVLGIPKISIRDSFFELGGDSILATRVIFKANQSGLFINPQHMFLHTTIEKLAALVGTTPAIQAEQGVITGEIPLMPSQRRFFEQDLPRQHHYNQSFLFKVRQPLDPQLLKQAVQQLLIHHDALRLRFVCDGSTWKQIVAEPDARVPFTRIDLSALPEAAQASAFEAAATKLQTSLNLSEGPLMQVALVDLGGHQPNNLLIIVHHLLVDGFSWRILIEDLDTACRQLSHGTPVQLPPKTTSLKHWAERLVQYAQSAELRQELDYWLAPSRTRAPRLPIDFPTGDNTIGTARSVLRSLSVDETLTLIQAIPKVYHTEIMEVLLAALALTFVWWTDQQALLVEIAHHGREPIFEDADLSRTIGWFSVAVPVLVELDPDAQPTIALQSVKAQLRRMPHKGIGHALLRYLGGDSEEVTKLRSLPRAEILFDYWGQFDQNLVVSELFEPLRVSTGQANNAQGEALHLLAFSGEILAGQLHLSVTYSENLYRPATIERLAEYFVESLRAIIRYQHLPSV